MADDILDGIAVDIDASTLGGRAIGRAVPMGAMALPV